jgi:hypothetical protein
MITNSDRNVFLGAHVTEAQKEILREEAERRNVSMSALVSQIIERWLVVATKEDVDPVRANKRRKEICPNDPRDGNPCQCATCVLVRKEKDEPLPFEDV